MCPLSRCAYHVVFCVTVIYYLWTLDKRTDVGLMMNTNNLGDTSGGLIGIFMYVRICLEKL